MALIQHTLDGVLDHPLVAASLVHIILSGSQEAIPSELTHDVLSTEDQLLGKVTDAAGVGGKDGMRDLVPERTSKVVRNRRTRHHCGHARIVRPGNEDEPSVGGNGGIFANEIGQLFVVANHNLGPIAGSRQRLGGEIAHKDKDGEGRHVLESLKQLVQLLHHDGIVQMHIGQDDEHPLFAVLQLLFLELFQFRQGRQRIENITVLQSDGVEGTLTSFDDGTAHPVDLQDAIDHLSLDEDDGILRDEPIGQHRSLRQVQRYLGRVIFEVVPTLLDLNDHAQEELHPGAAQQTFDGGERMGGIRGRCLPAGTPRRGRYQLGTEEVLLQDALLDQRVSLGKHFDL